MSKIDPGQINIFDLMYKPFKITKPIRLIELFAGIGSQAMALKSIGANFEHWKVVEFDKYAIASYNAIHGTNFPTIDVTKIHGSDLEIVDLNSFTYLLTYSFPCTDLSTAGKMLGMEKGSNTRSSLLWEVERLLNECENLPQVLVMENVPQVHAEANFESFKTWLKFLETKGYTSFWQDMNAKDYGVAQSRNRTIVVSFLGEGSFHFPEPYPLEKTMKDYLEEEVEESFYLNNKKAKILIDKLILDGKILTDRQTDRQLTYVPYKQKESPSQTPSHQDMMPGFVNIEMKGAESVKLVGYTTDKPHQSTAVYDPNGISPCVDATFCRHAERVLECKKV